jgi:RNA polymerase sigma-70 factor (ECF subfamily)
MRDPLADPRQLIRRIYAYAAYRLGDGPDADDVTSETFERALRYRDSFDPRRGDPASWLIGIARRCIADAAFKRELPTEEPIEQAVEGHEDDALRRIEMRAAVAQLDERDRELVSLRYGADLTAQQIGELLEMRTNAVEVALHRALVRLRSIIEGDERAASETSELKWTPRAQD